MRRALGLAVGLGLIPALLSGCSLSPSPSTPTSGDADWLAGALTSALAAGDEATFDSLFSGLTNAGIRGWVWTNLTELKSVTFAALDDGTLQATWRADGNALTIDSVVGRIGCNADKSNCTVTDLAPQPGNPAPFWLLQPMEVISLGKVQVMAPTDDATATDWLRAAQAAQQTVTDLPLGQLRDYWDGTLVIELPADANALAQRFGEASAAGYTTIGAVTQLLSQSRDPGQSGVAWTQFAAHIIVNPLTTGSSTPDERLFLITHEAVHAATGAWPIVDGATWVSEGLAESVAMDAVPSQAGGDIEVAKRVCTADGLAVPTDADYRSDSASELGVAYAVGGVVVGLIRAHLGDAASDALLALRLGKDAPNVDLPTWTRTWCDS